MQVKDELVLTDVRDRQRRHVFQEPVHCSVPSAVQLVLRHAEVEGVPECRIFSGEEKETHYDQYRDYYFHISSIYICKILHTAWLANCIIGRGRVFKYGAAIWVVMAYISLFA